MKTTHILLGAAALLMLSGRRSTVAAAVAQQRSDYLNDPTNWGSDMWSRLYGEDLALAGGQHNAQSGLTAYGVTNNSMGYIGSAAR
ncbi:MAG: hypothetical protein ACJ8LG_21665 [Massilia sp.]